MLKRRKERKFSLVSSVSSHRGFSSLSAPCTASLRFANVEQLDLASVHAFEMRSSPGHLVTT